MKYPSHVVVDTLDGYVFRNDADGLLFDGTRAVLFADNRNLERKPGHRTYRIFRLEPEHTATFDDSALTDRTP